MYVHVIGFFSWTCPIKFTVWPEFINTDLELSMYMLRKIQVIINFNVGWNRNFWEIIFIQTNI